MAEVFWRSWNKELEEQSINDLFDAILLKKPSPFPDHIIVPEFKENEKILITTYIPSDFTLTENNSLMNLVSYVVALIPEYCQTEILLASSKQEITEIWTKRFTICKTLNNEPFIKLDKPKSDFSPFSSLPLKNDYLSDWYIPLSIDSANQIIPVVPLKVSPIFQVAGVISSFFWFLPTKTKNQILIQKTAEKRTEAFMEILVLFFNRITLSGTLYQGQRNFSVFGNDPASVDAFSSALMSIKASSVLTTKFCRKKKIGMGDLLKIHVQGERFKKPILREQPFNKRKYQLYFDINKCILENKCIEACPSQAIFSQNGNLFYVKKQCVNCGLCISICPENAIKHV